MRTVAFLSLVTCLWHIANCRSDQTDSHVHQHSFYTHYLDHLLDSIGLDESFAYLETKRSDRLIVWVASVVGAFLVGICGILPAFILPRIAGSSRELTKSTLFKNVVSFSAGCLLGDIFFNLLQESYSQSLLFNQQSQISSGLWSIAGILVFFCIEKLFPDDDDDEDDDNDEGDSETDSEEETTKKRPDETKREHLSIFKSIKSIGVLNLIANVVENFTHGIAIAGGFQASFKFGVLSLFATLIHEIPHEIGDFIILLKSGLNYKQAAIGQLVTASGGIFGAVFALICGNTENAENSTAWILPFTSGSFLYIALVNILPEIHTEKDFRSSLKQIFSLFLGIFTIYLISFIM